MTLDELANHLPVAGTFDRAAVPLGLYLAWCANLQLLSPTFAEIHAALVLRVRFREITGSELLVAGAGGRLETAHLNAEGLAFARVFLPDLLHEIRRVFDCEPYDVKDDWDSYDRLAPSLTRRLMAGRSRDEAGAVKRSGPVGRLLGSTDRSWWRRR